MPSPCLLSPSWCVARRTFTTSSARPGIKDYLKTKFIFQEDYNKRPSQMVIKAKGLPENTPTIGEIYQRDRTSIIVNYDERAGYHVRGNAPTARPFKDMSYAEIFKISYTALKNESKKFYEELKEDRFSHFPHPGDTKVIYKFDTEEDRSNWKCTADSSWGEGYSTAELKEMPGGSVLFSGVLSTRSPDDGRNLEAGYVNMKAREQYSSFYRLKNLNWDKYTDLTMLVRGDGRCYRIIIHVPGYLDLTWFDQYAYPLHTRGGPYWQYVRIPLGKFVRTSKGFIKETQGLMPFHEVTGVGITLCDKIDGPFSLEVAHIGLHLAGPDREECKYETYKMPTLMYGTD